jgi:hypothetical protein
MVFTPPVRRSFPVSACAASDAAKASSKPSRFIAFPSLVVDCAVYGRLDGLDVRKMRSVFCVAGEYDASMTCTSKLSRRAAPSIEWEKVAAVLDARGNVVIEQLLSPPQCVELAALYGKEAPFRSRVVMARHGFGLGEYKYFSYPLPDPIAKLRAALYPRLAAIANRWHEAMGVDARFPADHAAFIRRCHAAGQRRPTPLLLQYGEGDYNCLHQDLYGQHVFPLQLTILLSQPGRDFTGGEFVMTEQRPRMQSRAEVVPLEQGDAVIFAVNERPVRGTRGVYRVKLRHGVSRVRSGRRHTAGIIFHDAA